MIPLDELIEPRGRGKPDSVRHTLEPLVIEERSPMHGVVYGAIFMFGGMVMLIAGLFLVGY